MSRWLCSFMPWLWPCPPPTFGTRLLSPQPICGLALRDAAHLGELSGSDVQVVPEGEIYERRTYRTEGASIRSWSPS